MFNADGVVTSGGRICERLSAVSLNRYGAMPRTPWQPWQP
jgi:hypothetical protein